MDPPAFHLPANISRRGKEARSLKGTGKVFWGLDLKPVQLKEDLS